MDRIEERVREKVNDIQELLYTIKTLRILLEVAEKEIDTLKAKLDTSKLGREGGEMSTTFENAMVGDEVEDLVFGKGRIKNIDKANLFPIKVNFTNDGNDRTYTFEGRIYADKTWNQTLYYPGVQIIAPERPKRKVKKILEVFVNVYPTYLGRAHYTTDEAKKNQISNAIASPVRCVGEYEVEE